MGRNSAEVASRLPDLAGRCAEGTLHLFLKTLQEMKELARFALVQEAEEASTVGHEGRPHDKRSGAPRGVLSAGRWEAQRDAASGSRSQPWILLCKHGLGDKFRASGTFGSLGNYSFDGYPGRKRLHV